MRGVQLLWDRNLTEYGYSLCSVNRFAVPRLEERITLVLDGEQSRAQFVRWWRAWVRDTQLRQLGRQNKAVYRVLSVFTHRLLEAIDLDACFMANTSLSEIGRSVTLSAEQVRQALALLAALGWIKRIQFWHGKGAWSMTMPATWARPSQ